MAAVLSAGCTLSHVAYVDTAFPTTEKTFTKCMVYGDTLDEVALAVRSEAKFGFRPVLVGYEHH